MTHLKLGDIQEFHVKRALAASKLSSFQKQHDQMQINQFVPL